ncbi:MAG TPA: hypothetical protein VFA04_09130 [Bryobacteraceae bacterium]|nr:hypothetical protein [Bryobacteraceae bacterium]
MRLALVGAVVLLLPCAAQDRGTSPETLVTEPGFHVERARASHDAYEIYDAVNRARSEIKAGDNAAASRDVARALTAAKRLDADGHGNGSVPIYIELTEQFGKGPAGAQPTLSSEADRLRVGATDEPVTAISTALRSGSMSLNMTGVLSNLQSADAALSDRENGRADSALAAVQNAFSIQNTSAEMPLLRARQNLNLAAEQARQGAWQVAQTTLETAVRQIREFAATPEGRAGDAAHLADEIDAGAKALGDRHDGVEAQIEDWWDHATRLGEK